MKFFFTLLKICSGVFVLLALAVVIYFHDQSRQSKQKFRKMHTGMRADEVINILGKPEQILYRNDSAVYDYQYFSGVLGKSTEPFVTFDTTNTVIRVIYGD